jgi:hypothetical protein
MGVVDPAAHSASRLFFCRDISRARAQRVERPGAAARAAVARVRDCQFGVEEREVERRVVDDQFGIAMGPSNSSAVCASWRLVDRNSSLIVDHARAFVDGPRGLVTMELALRRAPFDNSMHPISMSR